jgi:hypothetical protein
MQLDEGRQLELLNFIKKFYNDVKASDNEEEMVCKVKHLELINIVQFLNKKRNRKNIPDNEMCMGRKIDNLRCTRRRIPNKCFCKSHLKRLPNGSINDPMPLPKVKAKRGRKRKKEFDSRLFDPKYVTLWEDIIDSERYLIDSMNNVYSYNVDKPTFIGKKTLDNKIDLVKTSETLVTSVNSLSI